MSGYVISAVHKSVNPFAELGPELVVFPEGVSLLALVTNPGLCISLKRQCFEVDFLIHYSGFFYGILQLIGKNPIQ